MITAIIVAFVVEVARGHDGSPYAWLGAIGGLAYLVAIVVLRLRGRPPWGYGASSGGRSKLAKISGVMNAVISLISGPSNVITSIAVARQRPDSASRE